MTERGYMYMINKITKDAGAKDAPVYETTIFLRR